MMHAALRVREAQVTGADASTEAMPQGREAGQEARDAVTQLDGAVRGYVRARPYTALAIAAGVGFLYAVARGR